MKNLSGTIQRLVSGQDTYVSLPDLDRNRAIDFVKRKAGSVGVILEVAIDDDCFGTYNLSVTFGGGNEEEIADGLCRALNFKGNREVDYCVDSGEVVIHLDGIRADRIGI
jgi:hypothetical protein